MPLDHFDHQVGNLALELAVHVQHRLRALPVQLFDGRLIGGLDGFAEKLLQEPVLLLGGVPGNMQGDDHVGSCG